MKLIYECCINNCNNTFEINNYINDTNIIIPENWIRFTINTNNQLNHYYICSSCRTNFFDIF